MHAQTRSLTCIPRHLQVCRTSGAAPNRSGSPWSICSSAGHRRRSSGRSAAQQNVPPWGNQLEWTQAQSEEEAAGGSQFSGRKCRLSGVVLLTHVVEAIGLSCLGAHEWDVCPLAVTVGVALDQVVRRLAIPDPVTQELANTASVDNTVAWEEGRKKQNRVEE